MIGKKDFWSTAGVTIKYDGDLQVQAVGPGQTSARFTLRINWNSYIPLGLTTLIDILIVFFFTHPIVSLLARRPFFADGHRWSGLDPERLGVSATRYVGRGRFAGPRQAATEGSQA